MTTTPQTKFTGLSPLTTQLLRLHLGFPIQAGELKVGRTVVTFFLGTDRTAAMLENLIATQIPLYGASSKEIKRLRDLRHRLQAAVAGADDVGVQMTVPGVDPLRAAVLDIIADAWWLCLADDGWAAKLDDLATEHGADLQQETVRAWLEEVFS